MMRSSPLYLVAAFIMASPCLAQPAPNPPATPATPSVPATTSAPAAPTQPTYTVTGFRGANFGMTKEAVKAAAAKEFGIDPAKFTQGQNEVEKTTSLTIAVPTLAPGPGPARLTYVFGATQQTLMHVAISWVTEAKPTDAQRRGVVTAGLQLVNYFRDYAWADGRIAVGVPSGPNSIVLFSATDANDGGVQVAADGIRFDRSSSGGATEQSSPAPTGPAALTLTYTAKSKSPDIYRLPAGKF
jgi:hypothetical protein